MAFKMAFKTMNPLFFETVFGAGSQMDLLTQSLYAKGMVFESSLYTMSATYKGQKYQVGLSKSVSTIFEGKADPVEMEMNKKTISEWVNGLAKMTMFPAEPESPTPTVVHHKSSVVFVDENGNEVEHPEYTVVLKTYKSLGMSGNKIKAIKYLREVTMLGLKETKDAIEQVEAGKPFLVPGEFTLSAATDFLVKMAGENCAGVLINPSGVEFMPDKVQTVLAQWAKAKEVPTFDTNAAKELWKKENQLKTPKKPAEGVVKLRDAQALGQKVYGTSAGSVYHTVAVNPRVKVAARILDKGVISIRAEWKGAKHEELQALNEGGLSVKGDYASTHFSPGDVPVGRVIGAFILGLGLDWDEVITNSKNLVIDKG